MLLSRIAKIGGGLLLGLVVFGFSYDRGTTREDPEDHKLEAFVVAAAAVDGVMASWQPKIVHADAAEARTLRERANREIRASIEDVDGITYSEYREIRHSIAVDPEMFKKVQEIINRSR